ncbi:MAG: sulfatase-like hydrolase/transferase [Fidelibacterota bacterium]
MNLVIFLEVLFLGGFRFAVGGLTVSATHLRNPFLLTLGFALLAKILHPSFALGKSPLGRIGKWVARTFQRLRVRDATPVAFWISLLFLNSLLFLPSLLVEMDRSTLIPLPPLHGDRGWYDTLLFFVRRENNDLFRISGELLAIATLVVIARRIRIKRWAVRFGLGLYLVLLAYQIYESLSLRIFGERPLFYSDLLLFKDAAYLVVDLWSSRLMDTAVRLAVWGVLTATAIGLAFRFVTNRLERIHPSSPAAILGMFIWPVVLFSSFWYDAHDSRPTVRWIIPRIVENVGDSVQAPKRFQTFEQGRPLPYAEYWSVRLNRKPNLFLFLVESYGKVLAENPRLRGSYQSKMGEVQDLLTDSGWHVATNFSAAPISGGKSWLSMGTVLAGIEVKNQALYSFLLRSMPDYPHLVRFMKSQGYTAAVLQPTMRPRPGFPFERYESFFDYDLWIYQRDLDYAGDFYGWGMIPDQYSLNHAHEKFIQSLREPFFLLFETVSSHSPWYDLPPYVDDWRRLGEPGFHTPEHAPFASLDNHWPRTWKKLSNHLKKQLGLKDVFRLEDYLAHMNYQIDVIINYILEKAPENSVFIILGDHQPPIITGGSLDFETPVHVIARDERFIRSLARYGFLPGTLKEPTLGGSIRHEALYSLLVRILAENYGKDNGPPLPTYRPHGVSLSVLRR